VLMQRTLAICVLLATMMTAGCGTAMNLHGNEWVAGGPGVDPYGGVAADFNAAGWALSTPVEVVKGDSTAYSVALAPLVLTVAILDVPPVTHRGHVDLCRSLKRK